MVALRLTDRVAECRSADHRRPNSPIFQIDPLLSGFLYCLQLPVYLVVAFKPNGAEPPYGETRAAKYAGLNVGKSYILGMAISGALAGMAGGVQILAVDRSMALGLSSGYGFDSIALALIGNNHPLGVILTSLLFGTLRNGATKMMVVSSIPIDIVDVMQAIILMFVAAPAIIRSLYRLRKPKQEEETVFVSGWGGGQS